MEAYIDDMLVKSIKSESHVADREETLTTVRRYRMRLNPTKCSFGVKAGKFLGSVVTEGRIEVNHLKVKVIQEMTPPQTLKEARVLTGRIVALSRFVSRLAERNLPFFYVLRKSGSFEWTTEC